MHLRKKEFREDIRRKLNELSIEDFHQKSTLLSEKLFHFLNQQNIIQKKIGAFAPFEKEPLWYKFFDVSLLDTSFPAAKNSSHDVSNEMVFKKTKLDKLSLKTDFGSKILGPSETDLIVIPEVVLMPGLAFTKKGDRLGRGKGYFDRYLESFLGIKIALGFEMQVFETIPVEEHDLKYDWLITEKDIYKV